MYYQSLRQGLNSVSRLVPYSEDIWRYIPKNYNKDVYVSLYQYTEEHKKQVDLTQSVAGISDTTTDRLYFDFDSKEDLSKAVEDSISLFNKLIGFGIAEKDIICCFTGSKGISIELKLNQRLTPEQFKHVVFNLAQQYPTFDRVVNDCNRIVRVINTKHQNGLYYKIPLTLEELKTLSIETIMEGAENPREWVFCNQPVSLPTHLFINTPKKEDKPKKPLVLDFHNKPKGWSNCKWALTQGYQVRGGERHEKLLCVAATSKALNYPKDMAYYWAKHAQEKGVDIYSGEPWDKEEFYERDLKSIYNNTWKGGTFSCKDGKTPWLTELCKSLGHNACKAGDKDVVSTEEVFGLFHNYAESYENNILTTGIKELDERCKFMVGTSNGILAPPGVGKTTITLGILNHNSVKKEVKSIFFSYDMFHSMVYIRLLQKHFNITQDEIFRIFKTDNKKMDEMKRTIENEYKNVKFCFKSGQTADEIYDTILDCKNSGFNVKLVIIDYNELVISGVTDPTQASAIVAQRLRQIANDTETCVVTLLQPSKLFSNPADEITTYQGAKGSGAIAQSLSLMLSLSRPGFSPRHPEQDKYLTINALKHRQGALFTVDLGWDGLTGSVYTLPPEGHLELKQIRANKQLENAKEEGLGH